MGCEQILYNLSYVLWGDNQWRAQVSKTEGGEIVIRVDLHYLRAAEARKVLEGIIALYRFPFILDVIHGYVHGTAIKQMIWTDFKNKRIQSLCGINNNYGETLINIR